MWHYVSITKCPAGFGDYQLANVSDEGYDDANDLLEAIESDYLYELTDEIIAEALPGQVEDIRGRIRNEPERVFAILHEDNTVDYFGLVQR